MPWIFVSCFIESVDGDCSQKKLVVNASKVGQRGRQTEGKSKRTKPLRIKAAPLLTPSQLRSTMRSIFKQHSLQYIPAPLCQLTLSHAMNKDVTQVCSEGSTHKQTRKHSEKALARLTKSTWMLVGVCVCSQPRVCAERLIKAAIIGDNWTEVLLHMSSSSAPRPQYPFPLPPSEPLSSVSPLTCPIQSASISHNPMLASAPTAAFQHCLQ